MKLALFTTAILITNIKSQTEYVSSVPQVLADVFAAAGRACTTGADCYALYPIPSSMTASWSCTTATSVVQSDGSTKDDITFCTFSECSTGSDCNNGETCYRINTCDDVNVFYEEQYNLYSTICQPMTLCNNIKTVGQWTDTTMCYEGMNDGTTFYSEEEVILCGGSSGTCVIGASLCKGSGTGTGTTGTGAPTESDCIDDKTCCTKKEWDRKGCTDLLFTEYLIYTIIVIALIVLCLCGCCCYCAKARRSKKSHQQTMSAV